MDGEEDEEGSADEHITAEELEAAARQAEARKVAQRARLKDQLADAEGIDAGEGEEFSHERLDLQLTEREVQRAAQEAKKRYAARAQREADQADYEDVDEEENRDLEEKRLAPSWQDPSLFAVRCKRGQEQLAVVQIMRRYFERLETDEPLEIKSAVCNPLPIKSKTTQAFVYIESTNVKHVKEAIKGLDSLAYGQYAQEKVAIAHMAPIMRVVRAQASIKPGAWVRFVGTMYKDDVAQVLQVDETNNSLDLRVIPRLDRAALLAKRTGASKKRKAKARPRQQLFDRADWTQLAQDPESNLELPEEVHDDHNSVRFNRQLFDQHGFLIMRTKAAHVETNGAKPTVEELQLFDTGGDADGLGLRGPSTRGKAQFQRGDRVIVTSDSQLRHMRGTVVSAKGDQVKVQSEMLDHEIEFNAEELSKFFDSGDHVRITAGRHEGQTGIVVHLDEGEGTVHVVSDLTMKEVMVRNTDLCMSTTVATSVDASGQFDLHGLVQIDPRTVGVVVRIERDLLHVLDQSGTEQQLRPAQVQPVRSRRPGQALDAAGCDITVGAEVRVAEGQYKGRDGAKVLHVSRNFVFLFQRQYLEHNGVYVCRSRQLRVSGGVKAASEKQGWMLPPQSPSSRRAADGQEAAKQGRRGKHELLHKKVRVIKGPLKGNIGIVTDVIGDHTVRVEMHASYKTTSFPISQVKVLPKTQGLMSSSTTTTQQLSTGIGARTPVHGAATPMYGGATPGYGGATPGYGGATPSHGASTPVAGDATPAYQSGGVWDPAFTPAPAETPRDDEIDAGASPYASSAYGDDASYAGDSTSYAGDMGSVYSDATSPYTTGVSPYSGASATAASPYSGASATVASPYTDAQSPYTSATPTAYGTPRDAPGWLAPGVHVTLGGGGIGVIVLVLGAKVKVRHQNNLEEMMDAGGLVPVRPSVKDQMIKVVDKESEWFGKTGVTHNFDDDEAVVEIDGDTNLIEIEQLAVFDASFV